MKMGTAASPRRLTGFRLDPEMRGHGSSAGLRLRPDGSLSSAVPGDERREPRARRYDQLPRKPAEPQHEARARTRCVIEAADCAHDDTGALSAGLDSDVRRSVAQIGDEVHALIGHRNVEPIR